MASSWSKALSVPVVQIAPFSGFVLGPTQPRSLMDRPASLAAYNGWPADSRATVSGRNANGWAPTPLIQSTTVLDPFTVSLYRSKFGDAVRVVSHWRSNSHQVRTVKQSKDAQWRTLLTELSAQSHRPGTMVTCGRDYGNQTFGTWGQGQCLIY